MIGVLAGFAAGVGVTSLAVWVGARLWLRAVDR